MNSFLLYCAACNPHILELCPSQKTKYVCIGGAVLATALLACCSGGFTYYTIWGNLNSAIAFGLFWGIIIFNLDRLFLASHRVQEHSWQEILVALPRLALAILISIVISKPLELAIFKREIDAELTSARNIAYMEAKRRLDTDSAFRDEAQQLERENQVLRQEITDAQAQSKTAYDAYIAEAEGTAGSGLRGRGPVFEEKKAYAADVEHKFQAQKEDNATKIHQNQVRLSELQAIKQHQLEAADKSLGAANGLLARVRALHALCRRDEAIAGTSLIVTLLLLALEICPLALKLLGTFNKRRPYERLLDAEEAQEEAQAQIATFEAENQAITEIAIIQDRDKVRFEAQRTANAQIVKSLVDGQHALAQDVVRAWHEQQRALLKQDPDQFFQIH